MKNFEDLKINDIVYLNGKKTRVCYILLDEDCVLLGFITGVYFGLKIKMYYNIPYGLSSWYDEGYSDDRLKIV